MRVSVRKPAREATHAHDDAGRFDLDPNGGDLKRERCDMRPLRANQGSNCYQVTVVPYQPMKEVTRTQTGVRLETRLLKVLKALATELEMPLGDLIEGIVLHAFEGKAPFSSPTLRKIKALKGVYGLDLAADDAHRLREAEGNV